MSHDEVYTGADFPITPYIGVSGALEAIEFYAKAFGATKKGEVIVMPDGKVGHAELSIFGGTIMLADEFPGMNTTPKALGGSPVSFMLAVQDVASAFKKAVVAGCEVVRPIEDQFYGDRSGTVKCPFGYAWTLSQHVEDLSGDEIMRRAHELFGGPES